MIWETKTVNGCSIVETKDSVEFLFEDSVDCGGKNNNVQSGVAVTDIDLLHSVDMKISINGIIDANRAKSEHLLVVVDGFKIIELYNTYDNKAKFEKYDVNEDFNFILRQGHHDVIIRATTSDNVGHYGCLWKIKIEYLDFVH
jgi:hypothetical protein